MYLAKERLALISFGNNQVQTVIPPRRAPQSLVALLDEVPAGGGTPLRQALLHIQQMIKQIRRLHATIVCRVYLLTDARSTDDVHGIRLDAQVFIIDTEQRAVPLARAASLATKLGAHYLSVQSLPAVTPDTMSCYGS